MRNISEQTLVETLVGRFDQHTRKDFNWRMDHAISRGYRFCFLNLVDVSFIDSAALGWLVLAQRRFARIGGKLGIIASSGFVRDILELTELNEWIPIFQNEDEAWKAFEVLESVPAKS